MRIHQVAPKIYHTYSKIWVNRDWVIRFLGFFWWFLRSGARNIYLCGFLSRLNDKIDVKGEVKQVFYWIPSVAPMTESVDSLSRSDAEIVSKRIPSVGRRTELMDSLSSSEDRIGGFPQQVGGWNCQQVDSLSSSEDRIDGFPQQLWGQNRWIPSVALRTLGSYLVNFGPFDLIFDPLWGFSVKIAFWNLS